MNQPESDLLRRAAATLRSERPGHNPGSGFTRARILNDLRTRRSKRSWWRFGFPLGIILAGTTAWASANGSLPAIWVTVSTLLNLPITDNGSSERSLATSGARRDPALTDQPTFVKEVSSLGLAAEPESTATPGPTPAEVSTPAASLAPESMSHEGRLPLAERVVTQSRKQPPPAPTSVRAPTPSAGAGSLPTETTRSEPTPQLEAEIDAFRAADDLYRHRRDLRGAVDAYRRYVRDYPSGRFVPEAKYNTALALVELGRSEEARPMLEPFAAGAYGTYRQSAARELLDALAR